MCQPHILHQLSLCVNHIYYISYHYVSNICHIGLTWYFGVFAKLLVIQTLIVHMLLMRIGSMCSKANN